MLRATWHMNDFTARKSDPLAKTEQKVGVVGDRRFRLRFGFDQGVAQPVLEGVPRAVGRRRMFDIEMRMHHRTAGLQ